MYWLGTLENLMFFHEHLFGKIVFSIAVVMLHNVIMFSIAVVMLHNVIIQI